MLIKWRLRKDTKVIDDVLAMVLGSKEPTQN